MISGRRLRVTQIVGANRPGARPAAASEVGGAADDDEAERLHQPHRDHVGGDELAQPDAGVEPLGRGVDQFLACGDLYLDLRIRPAEGCDQRLEQDRHHRARHGEARQPARRCPSSRLGEVRHLFRHESLQLFGHMR
jgi:hypothetical protein